MLTVVSEKIKNIETSALINLGELLTELGYLISAEVTSTDLVERIMTEVAKELPHYVIYTGYKTYYLIIVKSEIHLRTLRIATNPNHRQYIPIIKGENNKNYKIILDKINQFRLEYKPNDETKTEVLVFQHKYKDIFK